MNPITAMKYRKQLQIEKEIEIKKKAARGYHMTKD